MIRGWIYRVGDGGRKREGKGDRDRGSVTKKKVGAK